MTKNSAYFRNKNKTQNQVVAIGERALVQCVKSWCPPSFESRFPGGIIPFWIPILPERPHSDAEILKFEPLHYHFDFRFWHDRLINLFFTDGETGEDWQARVQLACEVIEIKQVVRLCYRNIPILSADYNFLPRLEEAYSNCSLLPGNICPHKGYKLLPNTKHPNLGTCPGHGLAFNFKTGQLCRRKEFTQLDFS
ncbi:hypothetical protein QUB60_06570 [Microcoleus sp. A2-C5]|uniref:hypothetical protein n=1 Tax=unclassified Microcoleus TaxID=2642155 RepID=UPI002FD5F675